MGPLHPDGCSKTPRGWTTTCCRKDTAKQDHAGSLKPGGSRFVLYQCFLSVILSHSIPCWNIMIVNSFNKDTLQLIYHQSIETKVLLYWRGGKPDVKSMYQRYSQSNQNIRLFCACLACNRGALGTPHPQLALYQPFDVYKMANTARGHSQNPT